MFSGIIQLQGKIQNPSKKSPATKKSITSNNQSGIRLLINCNLKKFPKLIIGESVCVDGACLTVIKINKKGFWVDVSPETISMCQPNMFNSQEIPVNLERALRYGELVGGHLISGHIDGVGKVTQILNHHEFTKMIIQIPSKLKRYLVAKGCIAVNGVSLTINKVVKNSFSVMIIPHTLKQTNLGKLKINNLVNLESDLLARYLINNQASLHK